MDFRLTIYPSCEECPETCNSFLFETKAELDAASDTCADLLLFMQDKAKIMEDHSNVFISEQKIGGEWVEIEENY